MSYPPLRSPRLVGTLIQRARHERGWTQRELADRMNVRQATVSALESGSPGTRLKTFFDALAALDLDIAVRPRSNGSDADLLP